MNSVHPYENQINAPYLKSIWGTEVINIRSILILGIAMNLLLIGVPVGVQVLVNHLTWAIYQQPTVFVIVLILIVFIAASIMRLTQSLLAERLQRRIFKNTALDFSHRLTHSRADQLFLRPSELVNRFFEVIALQKSSTQLLVDAFSLTIQTFFGILLISLYHWTLLIYAICVGFSIYWIVFGLSKETFTLAKAESNEKYRVVAWLEELAACSNIFRSESARAFADSRIRELIWSYLNARENFFRSLHSRNKALSILQATASVALLAFGGILVIKNHLSVGQLVAAELIVTAILLNIVKFHKHLEAYFLSRVAQHKILEALDLPMEVPGPQKLPEATSHTWTFTNVGLERQARFNTLFNSMNFEINTGESVCVLASKGAGKTTLFQLMMGYLSPTSGAIQVNGFDLKSLDHACLRDSIGYAKDIEIFPGTIAENLRLGRSEIDYDKIKEALECVGLNSRISQLEQGVDEKLQVNGTPLSSAQARLLMIARALLHSPSTLILDGILDSLDPSTALTLIKTLNSPDRKWTFILGTSNEVLANQFKRIIDLNQGVK